MHSHEQPTDVLELEGVRALPVLAIAALRAEPAEQVGAREKQNRQSKLSAIESAHAHAAAWRGDERWAMLPTVCAIATLRVKTRQNAGYC